MALKEQEEEVERNLKYRHFVTDFIAGQTLIDPEDIAKKMTPSTARKFTKKDLAQIEQARTEMIERRAELLTIKDPLPGIKLKHELEEDVMESVEDDEDKDETVDYLDIPGAKAVSAEDIKRKSERDIDLFGQKLGLQDWETKSFKKEIHFANRNDELTNKSRIINDMHRKKTREIKDSLKLMRKNSLVEKDYENDEEYHSSRTEKRIDILKADSRDGKQTEFEDLFKTTAPEKQSHYDIYQLRTCKNIEHAIVRFIMERNYLFHSWTFGHEILLEEVLLHKNNKTVKVFWTLVEKNFSQPKKERLIKEEDPTLLPSLLQKDIQKMSKNEVDLSKQEHYLPQSQLSYLLVQKPANRKPNETEINQRLNDNAHIIAKYIRDTLGLRKAPNLTFDVSKISQMMHDVCEDYKRRLPLMCVMELEKDGMAEDEAWERVRDPSFKPKAKQLVEEFKANIEPYLTNATIVGQIKKERREDEKELVKERNNRNPDGSRKKYVRVKKDKAKAFWDSLKN